MVLDPAEAAEIVARYPQARSAVLPLLWRVQERAGWVSDEAIAEVAQYVGVPAAEVASVVSFYHMFRRRQPPARRLQVCRSLSCALAGADELVERLRQLPGEGSDFCVETVECLAACDRAVAGLFNERLVGPLDLAGAAQLLQAPVPARGGEDA
jgi:NADH-quinone oxidoreductase subunit E